MALIRGVPPGGLLLILKQQLGSHLQRYFFAYKRALDEELSCIEFIESRKFWVVLMSGRMLIAFMIGFANLCAISILNKFCSMNEDSEFCPKNSSK